MPTSTANLTSTSVADTLHIGAAVGRSAPAGGVLAMDGPLGAGKTHLAKGIATGAGVADPRAVCSPTFVLINEYAGRCTIQHIDAYRLGSGAELAVLGFDELVSDRHIVLIEWAERVADQLPADHLAVAIEVSGEERRELVFRAGGPVSQAWLDATIKECRMPNTECRDPSQ